jgi:3-oxoacyl-(acyl-carrier-protein) synthase
MVTPCSDPTEAARAITLALADAGIAPDVDYVNAHAAGTPVGDVSRGRCDPAGTRHAADTFP